MARENNQISIKKGNVLRRTISQPIFYPVKQFQWENFQPAKH